MMKKLCIFLVLVVFILSAANVAYVWYQTDVSLRPKCNVQWTGEIDRSFAEQVRIDLHVAQMEGCGTLRAALMSPGGSVIWSVETSQVIKRAKKKGLIVEIHGRSMVASGATLVLAAGSPGKRFIAANTLALLHGVQRGGGFMEPPVCVDLRTIASKSDEDSNILRRVITLIISELSESVNQPFDKVEQWFRCGNEKAGSGSLLVELGIADKEE